jgi:hypothetical protein
MIGFIPLVLTNVVATVYDAQPVPFVVYSFALSAMAGIGLWAHTISYKPVQPPEKFKPHTDRLGW